MPNGLYSDQQGYDISYENGALTINPAILTVMATGQNKTYDGTASASVTFSDDRVSGDILDISGRTTFRDANAGMDRPIDVTGIGISGVDAGNYSLQSTYAFTTATIFQAPLTITADDVMKKVGAPLPMFTATATGFVNGESWSSLEGSLTFTTLAARKSPVGSYAITPSGYTSSNYMISYVDGTLVVYKPTKTK